MGKNHTLEHDFIKKQLEGAEGQTFLKDYIGLTRRGKHQIVNYKVRHEIPINGRMHRLDSVIFVHVPNEKTIQTIGIEIKGHRHNLLHDTKMYQYLGHTDYFFLAVPNSLVKPARIKAALDPRIGIIRMGDGKIIIFPDKQDFPAEFRSEVIRHAKNGNHGKASGTIHALP